MMEERNKALVLEAFDTLFNKRDHEAPRATGRRNCVSHVTDTDLAPVTLKAHPFRGQQRTRAIVLTTGGLSGACRSSP